MGLEKLKTIDGVVFYVLSDKHFKQATEVLEEAYNDSEPMSTCVKTDWSKILKPNKELFCSGDSIVGVAEESDEDIKAGSVVAVALGYNFTEAGRVSGNAPQLTAFKECEEVFASRQICDSSVVNKGKNYYLWGAAVKPNVQGIGVAHNMFKLLHERLVASNNIETENEEEKVVGFEKAFACCPSLLSQKIAKRAEAHDVHYVDYNEFDVNGQHPFASVAQKHTGCILYERYVNI